MDISHDFFVVAKLEVVLDYMIFVLLDFVLVNFAFLDLGQIPGNDELSTRSNDRILILAFDEVEPRGYSENISGNRKQPYLAGVKEILLPMYATCCDLSCKRIGLGFDVAGKLRSKPSWP